MKWKHSLEESLGAVRKGIAIYQTGEQLYDIGRLIIHMIL